MQSICLEGLGGEKKVDPRLQETTFIQHTFGGHLQSKVHITCFITCDHNSLIVVPLFIAFYSYFCMFDGILKFYVYRLSV